MDEFGNVTGGVRSPFVDVPNAVWSGSSTGESFCFIAGNEKPFDHAQLTKLYPDRKSYENKVGVDVTRLVKERLITREDADELIAEAKKAAIPQPQAHFARARSNATQLHCEPVDILKG